MSKEVHIVIENGLVQSVYADEDINVIVYDLDGTDYDYQDVVREEIDKLEKKYESQGCDYFDPETDTL